METSIQENGVGERVVIRKDEAILKTASIDVKVLRIDKRQMTLSVFRQLEEESAFTECGKLRDKCWGRINYTWGDSRPGTSYYVVWQKGDELRRGPIPIDDKVDVREWVSVGEEVLENVRQSRRFLDMLNNALETVEPNECSEDAKELDGRENTDAVRPEFQTLMLMLSCWLTEEEAEQTKTWSEAVAVAQDKFENAEEPIAGLYVLRNKTPQDRKFIDTLVKSRLINTGCEMVEGGTYWWRVSDDILERAREVFADREFSQIKSNFSQAIIDAKSLDQLFLAT